MRGINDRSSACDRFGGDLAVVVSKLHLDPPTVIGEIYRLLDHIKACIAQTLALQRKLQTVGWGHLGLTPNRGCLMLD